MPSLEIIREILHFIVEAAILLFEYIGVIILIGTGIYAAVSYVRRNPLTRLNLAKGLAMGLEFKLGSEILRTVMVRDLSEVVIVGAIILLRAALSFLINWEIKTEEAAHAQIAMEAAASALHQTHKKRQTEKSQSESSSSRL